jgi:hypothetical protein
MVGQDSGVIVYPFHSGARSAHYVVGVLLCLLIITIPIGIWIMIAASRARVEVRQDAVVARFLTTVRIPFAEVSRLGYLNVQIIARGIGGVLARKKVGGDVAVNLCVIDTRGKQRKFMVSMYENYQDVLQRVSWATQKPLEPLTVGLLAPKWPEAPAA